MLAYGPLLYLFTCFWFYYYFFSYPQRGKKYLLLSRSLAIYLLRLFFLFRSRLPRIGWALYSVSTPCQPLPLMCKIIEISRWIVYKIVLFILLHIKLHIILFYLFISISINGIVCLNECAFIAHTHARSARRYEFVCRYSLFEKI